MNQRSLKAISLEEWGETLGSALTAFSEKCGGKGLRLFPQIKKE
jgi:hypothetical protein